MQIDDFEIKLEKFIDSAFTYDRWNIYNINSKKKVNLICFDTYEQAFGWLKDFINSNNRVLCSKQTNEGQATNNSPCYKFCEDLVLKEIKEHIDSTYNSHYADEGRKIQAIEFLMDQPETAFGMLKGNAQKYLPRYGKKMGKNRKDLLKTIHYSMLLLYYDHYRENSNTENKI